VNGSFVVLSALASFTKSLFASHGSLPSPAPVLDLFSLLLLVILMSLFGCNVCLQWIAG